MRRLAPLLALAAVLAAAPPCAARGFELGVELLRAAPLGEFHLEGFSFSADGLISSGRGVNGVALYRLDRHFSAGLSLGYYAAHGGELFDLFGARADLRIVPLHALVQWRSAQRGLGVYAEQGLGYTRAWLDAEGVLPGGFDLDTLDRADGNASIWSGAGVSYGLTQNLGLRAGVRYHHTFTVALSENAVKFLLLTAGVRYGFP